MRDNLVDNTSLFARRMRGVVVFDATQGGLGAMVLLFVFGVISV
jgi:hypothetical protein